MVIRTWDDMRLINISMFSIKVEKLIETRFILKGAYGFKFFLRPNTVDLGVYINKDDAIKQLDDIEEFFKKHPSGIYKMK